jgi:predicted alpha/beta hydrolase family esterase
MHGSFGSPNENWFRWLEKELSSKGHEVILEQFPVDDWEKINSFGKENVNKYKVVQSVEKWENYFLENIYDKLVNDGFIFIGHSLAPVFFLHILEKYNLKVNKAIFVAPFLKLEYSDKTWQFYPVNKDFYKDDFDFNLIKNKIKRSIVVYGDNDPYVPIEKIKEFSIKLDATELIIKDGKHCGSNFKEFPQLLDLLI